LGEKLERAGGASRRFRKTLPMPIFADGVEEIAEDVLQLGKAIFARAIALDR
jgi:hypothetical protein